MARALERRALELLEHGEPSYQEACALAQQMLTVCEGPVALGAYVRVKAGIRQNTHAYPETTRFFAKFLADEFPGDSFLTLQIQMNRNREPHRDQQNASLPSLICNLSPHSPGGTWVEDPSGSLPMECPDGKVRLGTVITGRRYRLSTRDLWHASRPSMEDRLLLLGWVPSGWQHIPHTDMAGLLSLGFVAPHFESEQQGQLSRWGPDSQVQRSLESFGFRQRTGVGFMRKMRTCHQWGPGRLNTKVLLSSSAFLQMRKKHQRARFFWISLPTGCMHVGICCA